MNKGNEQEYTIPLLPKLVELFKYFNVIHTATVNCGSSLNKLVFLWRHYFGCTCPSRRLKRYLCLLNDIELFGIKRLTIVVHICYIIESNSCKAFAPESYQRSCYGFIDYFIIRTSFYLCAFVTLLWLL